MTLTLTAGSLVFQGYLSRTSARRAAEVFGRDLAYARSTAARSRDVVVVSFDETSLEYWVYLSAGDTMVHRSFSGDDDVNLDEIDLEMPGDTVYFSGRGIADLSQAPGSLGVAYFRAGTTTYGVFFNSMGNSRARES